MGRGRFTTVVGGVVAGVAMLAMAQGPARSGLATAEAATPVRVQVLNITDFHGYLKWANWAPNNNVRWRDPADGTIKTLTVGGGSYFAAWVKKLRTGQANTVTVSAGDNFRGWPFEASNYADEPTVEMLNYLDVGGSTTGNHELDNGLPWLRDHMRDGVCVGTVDVDSCFTDSTGTRFHGSDNPYGSGNMAGSAGTPVLPPYSIKTFPDGAGGDVKVGFIYLTTTGTEGDAPHVGSTDGTTFEDPIQTTNKYAAELESQGVKSIVVVTHEGAAQHEAGGAYIPNAPINDCSNVFGDTADSSANDPMKLAREASPSVDAIVTGHWHESFECWVNDPNGVKRPIIESGFHGKEVGEFQLSIDPATDDVIRSATTMKNYPTTHDIAEDAGAKAIVDYWANRSTTQRAQSFATVTTAIDSPAKWNKESAMANLAADSFFEAAKPSGAQLALVDPWLARGSLPAGTVNYGQVWDPMGAGNYVATATITGQTLKNALEQQWNRPSGEASPYRELAFSSNVKLKYDMTKPVGQRINPAYVKVDGQPLDLAKTYRVVSNSHLWAFAGPSDAFPALHTGYSAATQHGLDRKLFMKYVKAHSPLAKPSTGRVQAGRAGPVKGTPSGKCVDIANGSSTDGTQIRFWTCNGTAAQSWWLAGDGTLQGLGKCLDVVGGSTTQGAYVQLYQCNGSAAQQWVVSGSTLKNPVSGQCLTPYGNGTADGTRLTIWPCTGSAVQNYTWSAMVTP